MSKTFKTGERVTYQGLNARLKGLAGTVEKFGKRGSDGEPMTWVRFDDGKLHGVINTRLAPLDVVAEDERARKLNQLSEFSRGVFETYGAVTGRAPHVPVPTVEVRDAGNHGRLLGHLTRRPLDKLQGGRVEVAVPERVSVMRETINPFPPLVRHGPARLSFDVSTRRSPCGWESTVFLATSATLEDLLRIETFRLPGETDAQADFRRMRA